MLQQEQVRVFLSFVSDWSTCTGANGKTRMLTLLFFFLPGRSKDTQTHPCPTGYAVGSRGQDRLARPKHARDAAEPVHRSRPRGPIADEGFIGFAAAGFMKKRGGGQSGGRMGMKGGGKSWDDFVMYYPRTLHYLLQGYDYYH